MFSALYKEDIPDNDILNTEATLEMPCSPSGVPSEDQCLLLPLTHKVKFRQVTWSEDIINALNYWLDIPEDIIKTVREVGKISFNGSLLMDEICDEYPTEKENSAHKVYGVASTLNTANYVYGISWEKCSSLNTRGITKIYIDLLLKAYRGQGLEAYWKDNCVCPTETEYKYTAKQKVGSYLLFLNDLMQLFSKNKRDFSDLMELLGMYFQIHKEYCNLRNRTKKNLAGFCEGFSEGKFTFPIIHCIQSTPNATDIINIMRFRTSDNDTLKYCISKLEETGSFDYTLKILKKTQWEIRDRIKSLGGNPRLETIVNYLEMELNQKI